MTTDETDTFKSIIRSGLSEEEAKRTLVYLGGEHQHRKKEKWRSRVGRLAEGATSLTLRTLI